MAQVGSLQNNSFFNHNQHHHKLDHSNSNSLSQIFHLQLPELISTTQINRSTTSSAYQSDDSGIERTLNLSPSSPFPEDTDSDDAQSFINFDVRRSTSHLQTLHHPLKVDACYLNSTDKYVESARLSPPGTCAAAVDDSYYPTPSPKSNKPKFQSRNRFQILSYEQVTRLHNVLSKSIPIHSRHPGFPTITVKLNDLFRAVRGNLKAAGIPIRNIRLNGGAASYIIGREDFPVYNDIDVLVSVDLTSNSSTIQKVKSAVLNALISFLPKDKKIETSQQYNVQSQPQKSFKFKSLTGSCSDLQSDNVPTESGNSQEPSPALSSISSPVRIKSHLSSTELRNIDLLKVSNGTGSNSTESEFERPITKSVNDITQNPCSVHMLAVPPNTVSCSCHKQPNLSMPLSFFPLSFVHPGQHSMYKVSTPNSSFGTLSVNTMNCIQSSTPTHSSPSDGFSLRESYVYKQFRKFSQDDDCWSLLSLGFPSSDSKVIEFKFVDRMKRQFEFTVDSFQIVLDPLLSFYECNPAKSATPHFYPTVVAESVSGSFSEAVYHLENKLIATTEPEMIRGGGLLKYCRLLVSGYKPAEGVDVCTLEKYMSSRFFIDFQDILSQKVKLEAFLANHFAEHEINLKINYLRILYQVVSGSTICLMSHEHLQTLSLIAELLRYFIYYSHLNRSSLSLEWFAEKQNLILDKIYFGTQLFPVITRSESYAKNCPCFDSKLSSNLQNLQFSSMNTNFTEVNSTKSTVGACNNAEDNKRHQELSSSCDEASSNCH
ncbi:putative nucleotidyltransferase FAM46C [Schistosoma japonicum]|uniref:polynucleotide adenylyltransferase n=1 Tax=Schistosoma japonicum TaxID=6182 RepID=A0A4Z2CVE1_SCHJA|nr:Terminal nucleotidyltransferase 5C [Schistosoma japonicum]TNN08236.1 putative nucleotidyltransferase FAM46C [Schistosoma japonicum]